MVRVHWCRAFESWAPIGMNWKLSLCPSGKTPAFPPTPPVIPLLSVLSHVDYPVGKFPSPSHPYSEWMVLNECTVSLNAISCSQVCTYWYPLSDCWKNRGDGWHHWDGWSARDVYDYGDYWPHDTWHDRSTDFVLRHHPEKPFRLHHGFAAGPHHGSRHLFQVEPTTSSYRNQ